MLIHTATRNRICVGKISFPYPGSGISFNARARTRTHARITRTHTTHTRTHTRDNRGKLAAIVGAIHIRACTRGRACIMRVGARDPATRAPVREGAYAIHARVHMHAHTAHKKKHGKIALFKTFSSKLLTHLNTPCYDGHINKRHTTPAPQT